MCLSVLKFVLKQLLLSQVFLFAGPESCGYLRKYAKFGGKKTINSGRSCLDIIYIFVINEDGRKYQEQDSEETIDQIHLLIV